MIYLSVGTLKEGVEVGETRGCLVFEPSQQSLLNSSELQGLTLHHLTTLTQITPQLQSQTDRQTDRQRQADRQTEL